MIRVAAAQYLLQKHSSFEGWQHSVESWVREAVENKATLLVFPEYGSMELVSLMKETTQQDPKAQVRELDKLKDKFLETYQELAKKYQCAIVAPSIPVKTEQDTFVNRSYFVGPSGGVGVQDKKNVTKLEEELWGIVSGGNAFNVFETRLGDMAVCMSTDVEYPGPAASMAAEGAKILLAPSRSENQIDCNRVHLGARARAMENNAFVVVSQLLGKAPWTATVTENTGYAAIYSPLEEGHPEDGIQAKGTLNEPGWLYSELNHSPS
ncbi:nitrilase-related carbon-nitrogen hydrolase [Bdellovibrio bacteriovorus]|uniref:CN hydrolase domain-containing protein n=1 Tax=Bdellovibrio bacteriovorus TaxID=959 RepID=A0A1Z3N748_BDEBC|nr:nitrilase-related carbon-nitrogen hydrolase [Bdellovibrio bacteriovorus]ASD63312.1 hypothetical protein B9G79_06865 [Bdellovibrio bacteriovorus]